LLYAVLIQSGISTTTGARADKGTTYVSCATKNF
jgi:hypothetical protein